MNILLSNDDGVYAPGLKVLYESLKDIGTVKVVAPDRDRSGAGNSLTLAKPLRVRTLDNGFVSVDGTPADCVYLGVRGLFESAQQMIVSGINAGGNLGDDVIYSGTVAAAMEGRFLGFPAMAVSLVGDHDQYETAGKVVQVLVRHLMSDPLPRDTILNVNVPNVPFDRLKGYKVTRLGRRHPSADMIQDVDPRGNTIYWVGAVGKEQDAGHDTDFHAVSHDYVSITPLEVDLTRYNVLEHLKNWSATIK